jgi:hypothetical protein
MSNTTAVASIAPRTPFSPRAGRRGYRAAARIVLSAAAFVAATQSANAQAASSDHKTGFGFLVSSGSLVPTGDQRRAIKRADLTAAQLSYAVRPSFAVTATLGWARSRDIVAVGDPKLDVFTYDLGAELTADKWITGKGVSFSPFAGAGAGARSYNYRKLDVDATHNLAAYGSIGGELGYRRVRLRIEARDNVTGFKALVADGASGRRNDVTVMAGFRITAH